VVSSVLSFICDHVEVLIATGAQALGLLVEVFVAMVSVAWLCICLNRLCSCIYCKDYVSYVFILLCLILLRSFVTEKYLVW